MERSRAGWGFVKALDGGGGKGEPPASPIRRRVMVSWAFVESDGSGGR